MHLCVHAQHTHAHTHTHTRTHTHTHTCIHVHACMHILTQCILVYSNISPLPAQWGATALLSAAFGGSVLVGKMLLEDFNSTLDEVANVSVCPPICGVTQRQHLMCDQTMLIIPYYSRAKRVLSLQCISPTSKMCQCSISMGTLSGGVQSIHLYQLRPCIGT